MDQETEQEVEEVEEEEVEVEEVEERSANSLLWISSAANVLSWVILVIFIAWGGMLIYVQIAFGGWQPAFDVQSGYLFLSAINQLALGLGLFVLLQAVAKGSLVLLNIFDRGLD
jgi:hypothetical protein